MKPEIKGDAFQCSRLCSVIKEANDETVSTRIRLVIGFDLSDADALKLYGSFQSRSGRNKLLP
jgi:hypothetical protein